MRKQRKRKVHKSVQIIEKQIRKQSKLQRSLLKSTSQIQRCKEFLVKMENKKKSVNAAIELWTNTRLEHQKEKEEISLQIDKLVFINSTNLTIPINFGFCLLSYILEMQKSKWYGSTCYHIMRQTSKHFKHTLHMRWPDAKHAQTTKLRQGDIVTVLRKDRQNNIRRLTNLFRFGSKIENRLSKPACLEAGNKWMDAEEMRCRVIYLPYDRFYGARRDRFLVYPDIDLETLFVAFNICTNGTTFNTQIGRLRFKLKDIHVLNIAKRSELWKIETPIEKY